MIGNKNRASKSDYLEKVINIFFLCTVSVTLIASLISIIVLASKKADMPFLTENSPQNQSALKILTYFILYTQMIPIAIYGILDIVSILTKIKLER